MARRKQTPDAQKRITAAYLRVSTEQQAVNGYGLDAQYEKCYQQSQIKDIDAPRFFIDEGVSGSKPLCERPKMGELLSLIEAGQVETVIVYSLDRVGRKAAHILNFVDLLEKHHTQLIIVREALDTSTPHGRFALTILAAMAQLERDYISERTREALAQTPNVSGRVGYGYVRGEDGKVHTDPHTYPTLQRIVTMRDQGDTLQTIADTMNAEQIATPRNGKLWRANTVKSIIDSVKE